MLIIESALKCPRCVIIIMGDHAGEDTNAIFERKKVDIQRKGMTFVFDKIETDLDATLGLWNYAEAFDAHKPIKFILGCSTCAIRKDMKAIPDRMKSRYRKIVAAGRIMEPYSAWLR